MKRRMRDLTTNQKWMKPGQFPNYIELYIEDKSIVTIENNQSFVIPNEIPQPLPGWVLPKA